MVLTMSITLQAPTGHSPLPWLHKMVDSVYDMNIGALNRPPIIVTSNDLEKEKD